MNNYAGMDPSQIEGIVCQRLRNKISSTSTRIKSIESKNIQNFVQVKLTFYPGTDMAAAMWQL